MQQLADVQRAIRHAIVAGDPEAVESILAIGSLAGMDPKARLHIHRRHYETSLVTALLGKFPATVWLTGSQFVAEAARQYVRAHPPQRPCIAEYGQDFPDFLADFPGAGRVPYLRDFARLEWHVGYVAIAVDEPAIPSEQLAAIANEDVADRVLKLQPGLRYLSAPWPVDNLLKVYLSEAAPERLEFEPEQIWLEIRGARGEFRLERLAAGEFTFRKAITEGRSLGDATEEALEIDGGFDPDYAIAAVFASALVTAIHWGTQ